MEISIEENELLLQLTGEYSIKDYDPSKHVTALKLAEKLNVTYRKASLILNDKFRGGELERERIKIIGARWQWGYYIKSKQGE